MTDDLQPPLTPPAPEPEQPPAPNPAPAYPPLAPLAGPPLASAPARTSPLVWMISLVLAAMVGALLFVGGYLAAGARTAATCSAPTTAFEAFCQAYDKLKRDYVDQLDDGTLVDGAIRGMFEYGVADPFSGYMTPEDYRRALSDLSGEFTGIGAEMGVRNTENPDDASGCTTFSDTCVLVVIAPLEDSPAQKAGLQAGDRVTAIDGDTVNGLALTDAVKKVRGEAGTEVTLSVVRGSDSFDLTITRAKIQMREVTSKLLDGKIGYVALHGFSDGSTNQFREAIGSLLDQGATSFVFDLRDNPGGYIEAARKIASEFIGEGLIFTQESSGDEVKRWEATGEGQATDPNIPVVVLVNNGSASASEIVAAAMKETGRATIIGQHTYGKNTVQLWEDLDNGGGVRITISRWFTPDHNSVHPDGVQPDVTVEVPDGTPADRDLYLEAALQFLSDRATGGATSPSPAPSGSPAPAANGGGTSSVTPFTDWLSYDPRGLFAAPA